MCLLLSLRSRHTRLMRNARVAALALAAAVSLAGCATPSSSAPTMPSVTATETAPAEQVRETGLTRPAIVFDGDCEQVFNATELATILGEDLSLRGNHFSEMWAGDYLFDQNGGFECTWSGNGRVIALLLPESAVDYEVSDRVCYSQSHDTDLMTCQVEAVANGIRLSGLVSVGTDEAAAAAAADALIASFEQKAAQQSLVPVPLPAAGAWQILVDCAAVAAGADLSAVPGLGAETVGDQGGYGKDVTRAENELKGEWSALNCYLQGSAAMVPFIPAGGERWREQGIAARADATPLELDGVEAAYAVPLESGKTLVYAFTGPNMLLFEVQYTKNAAGIATALFASLDATAVS